MLKHLFSEDLIYTKKKNTVVFFFSLMKNLLTMILSQIDFDDIQVQIPLTNTSD